MTPDHLAKWREEQKALFPGSLYGSLHYLHKELVEAFEGALRAGREEAIQIFLTGNPYLLQYAISNSGHHGVWVFPKSMIRSKRVDGTPGLIPDFLLVASNSLGYSWHIIELKRWDTQFANGNGDSLSESGQKAVVQCASYLSHFDDYIETVRNCLGVPEIKRPKKVIILIGDALNESEKQKTRRDEHQTLAPNLEIVSYDRIRRGLANDTRPR
jgi:hypothetical protein